MSRNSLLAVFLLAALLPLPSTALTGDAKATSAASAELATAAQTRMALRDLWVEHAFWIRSYVVATHAGDTRQSKVAEGEVVSNAKALAGTIAPFYGQPAADGLLKLLAGHWAAVRDYNSAILTKSETARDRAEASLTSNAREIARFLSGANPHLPEDAVFGLLSSHAGHHIAQINQIASQSFQDEAATWRAMRKHMLVIADSISEALQKQFPQRFKEAT
jgi:hypothetical protein